MDKPEQSCLAFAWPFTGYLSEVELPCSSDDKIVVVVNNSTVERICACHTSCFVSLAQNASGCQMAVKTPLCAIEATWNEKAGCAHGPIGSVTTKVVPTPTWLSTVMVPLWSSMASLVIVNPKPVPEIVSTLVAR